MSKTCTSCLQSKVLGEFHKDKQKKDGLRGKCAECFNKANGDRVLTVDMALANLLKAAKSNSKNRRGEAAMVSIDMQYLLRQYDVQHGLCFYSGLPLSLEKCTWKMSLERTNTCLGYIPDVAVLCCLGFNVPAQWTVEKVKHVVLHHYQGNFPPIPVNVGLVPRQRKKAIEVVKENRDGVYFIRCTICLVFHEESHFGKDKGNGCKECVREKNEKYKNSPRGHRMSVLGWAKHHTKARNENTKRTATIFALTLDDVDKKLKLQGGRCAISNMPLAFGTNKDWACSLERRDVNLGYTPENVILIAVEFQATDPTVKVITVKGVA